MKKKLIFEKYEKNTQAFVGIVSDILDSGKNRLKSKDAKRKKEVFECKDTIVGAKILIQVNVLVIEQLLMKWCIVDR